MLCGTLPPVRWMDCMVALSYWKSRKRRSFFSPAFVLENVSGISRCMDQVTSLLKQAGYTVVVQSLNPLDLGEPLSLPRFYFLGIRKDRCWTKSRPNSCTKECGCFWSKSAPAALARPAAQCQAAFSTFVAKQSCAGVWIQSSLLWEVEAGRDAWLSWQKKLYDMARSPCRVGGGGWIQACWGQSWASWFGSW